MGSGLFGSEHHEEAAQSAKRLAAMADGRLRVSGFARVSGRTAGRRKSGRSRIRPSPSVRATMCPSTVPRVSNRMRSPCARASAHTNRAGLRAAPFRAQRLVDHLELVRIRCARAAEARRFDAGRAVQGVDLEPESSATVIRRSRRRSTAPSAARFPRRCAPFRREPVSADNRRVSAISTARRRAIARISRTLFRFVVATNRRIPKTLTARASSPQSK